VLKLIYCCPGNLFVNYRSSFCFYSRHSELFIDTADLILRDNCYLEGCGIRIASKENLCQKCENKHRENIKMGSQILLNLNF
jgi:hypothetical protein